MLNVQDLSITFTNKGQEVRAVQGLKLTIGQGEILALVGESGSGKSVLALSLLGLLPSVGCQVTGTITFQSQGHELMLNQLTEKQWRTLRGQNISLVLQDHMNALNPVRTIGDQFLETIWAHRPNLRKEEATRLAMEMLEKVLLPKPMNLLKKYPFELSGGMGQRVMIAMALVHKPQLLITDEPTTALDVTIQAQIINLLLDLKEDLGTSILFISHDLSIVRNLADRVAVIYKGRLVEEGLTDGIFMDPGQCYTQKLLGFSRGMNDY